MYSTGKVKITKLKDLYSKFYLGSSIKYITPNVIVEVIDDKITMYDPANKREATIFSFDDVENKLSATNAEAFVDAMITASYF